MWSESSQMVSTACESLPTSVLLKQRLSFCCASESFSKLVVAFSRCICLLVFGISSHVDFLEISAVFLEQDLGPLLFAQLGQFFPEALLSFLFLLQHPFFDHLLVEGFVGDFPDLLHRGLPIFLDLGFE